MAKFSDVLTIINGKNQKHVECEGGKYPIYGSGGIMGYASDYICEAETVIIGRKGNINKPIFVETPFWNVDTAFGLCANRKKLNPKYLYYFCEHFNFEKLNTTVTIPSLTKANLLSIEMPLPDLNCQKQICIFFDKIGELISLRKQQLAKLDELVKVRFVEMFGDTEHNTKSFPVSKLADLCCVSSSKRIYQDEQSTSGIPFLRISDLSVRIDHGIETCELYISPERYQDLCARNLVPVTGDILITSRGTLGKCYIVKKSDKFYFQDGMISWLSNIDKQVSSVYISYLFSTSGIQKQIANLQAGSTVAYLSISMLKKLDIIVPPLSLQNDFAAFVERVDQQKQVVQQSLDKLELMKKALMQEYFG